MAMSKQEFFEMAKWISGMSNGEPRDAVFNFAVHMGKMFNPNFDITKFHKARFPEKVKKNEVTREGLRAGGIKLISLTPLREEK